LTIKEIAQIAGVSPTTVSNVIHGNVAKVSPNTKSKVEAVLKEYNYTTNMAAPMLAQQAVTNHRYHYVHGTPAQ